MLVPNQRQRGFCPSAWSPLAAGDGLLLRLRLVRGHIAADQLRGLANAAKTYGNGVVELTRRANLQLRGIAASSLPDLQAELVRLDLAKAPEQEGRAELLVCPLVGLERPATGVEGLIEPLAALLAERELMAAWSHKLVVVLGSGGGMCDAVQADMRIEVDPTREARAELSVAGTWRSAHSLGLFPSENVVQALRLLLSLERDASKSVRMRDVVARRGATALQALLEPWLAGRAPAHGERAGTYLGLRAGARRWFGFRVPFGALQAEDCLAVADAAEHFGSGSVAVTPARALLLLDVNSAEEGALAHFARGRGFELEAESGLELVACSGAPACSAALGETRRLASELGLIVRGRLHGKATLHVSGCDKSCARDGAAEITLVHRADGLRLGFGVDAASTSGGPPLSPAQVRAQLSNGSLNVALRSSKHALGLERER